MISPTTPMKAAGPDQADRRNGWFGYAGNLTGLLMVALVAGHGTGLAEPPAPTQLPTGEQVVGGAATISRQQATMTINQSTSRAAIDWHTFDIGSQAHVNIRQPSTDSVLFNRIQGNNPSQIFGGLTANGQVYLSNPSGFYFAPSASVNVGGLVATTHQLSLDEFMAGRDRFSRNGSTGGILNEGQLKAALGGYIALLAPEVRNHGVIMAELGTVALAAGEAYELRFDPARRLEGLRVEPAQIRTLVENKQAVLAPGGLIVLSAQGASQLQGSVVRHDGTLEASSLVSKGGRIMLEGDAITLGAHSTIAASGATGGGEVLVGGGWQGSGEMRQATTVTMASDSHIDVSATQRGDGGTAVLWSDVRNPAGSTRVAGSILANGGPEGGDGGRVETSGYHLDVDQAQVTAGAPRGQGGRWLLDPVGNTTLSDASSIVSSLNSGTSVEYFVDNGHLTMATNINKTSGGDATLTIKADGNIAFINQNQSITSTSGRLNTLLWADQDSSVGGWLLLNPGTSIQTNGGGLWMGGGSGTMSWTPYAGGSPITVGSGAATAFGSADIYRYGGINLSGGGGSSIRLNAGAGNVYLSGTNISTADSYLTGTRLFNTQITGAGVTLIGSGSAGNSTFANHWGVSLESASSITASGTVTLNGTGGGSSASGGNHYGVLLDNSTISTTSSPITITGTGGSSTGVNNHGVKFTNAASVHATSGQISITGTGGGSGSSSGNDGVAFEGNGGSVYTTDSGTVTLTGTKGLGANSEGIATNLSGSGTATLGHARQTGNLDLVASNISFGSTGTSQILGTGAASITPLNATSAFTAAGDFSNLALSSSLTGLTIGNRVNTADITLGRVTSIDGPVNLYGGNVNLNANLSTTNATTGDVSITASTGLTGSSGITLANGRTLTVTQSGNTTYNGVISGSGAGLTKLGIGDLSLGGASTYTGATTVSGGILSLAAADRLPDSTALTVDAGATFSLNGFNETVGSIAGNGLIVNGAVVRDGLVLWLDAGNTSSYNGTGNTWYDLSGNGYHSTIYGSPTYSSANSLFTFANNSQYVRLSTLPANFLGSTVTGITIFSVANFGATAENWERVVDLGNAGAGGNAPNHNIILSRAGTASRLNFEIYTDTNSANPHAVGTNSAITNGKSSYAGTADGTNFKIFKDGTLNTTTAQTALPTAVTRNDNFIGKSNWTGDDTFRGDIGTLMVYNRALSAAEIAKNHQLLFNRSEATLTVGGNNASSTFSGQIENGVGTLNLVKQGSGTLTLTGANSYAGTTTVSAGTLAVGNGGSTGTLGSGVVTSNAALVFNRSGNVALSTMASNASGIGGTGSVSATASGDLTIDRAISVGGPVTLTASNGNLAINSAVATPASTITLSAGSGGTVTQGVSGSLSATNLALLGGNVTLEHSANAVSTLAASGVTTLTYADSNALTIGTVGATTGISATGPVRIETVSGDLTVAENIATTNTGTSALILNAGKGTAAGTATGGNLLISGAPTMTIGSGGRATLYSGSISGSTGLTGLVGSGSGRFRYNSDESTTNYTLALGSGLHGIYRENPTVSVAVENKTITYGDALPMWTYTTSGMVNGDQVAQAFASPSVSVGGTTSTSGSYTGGNHTLSASGMTSSQLGYSVGTLTNGTMTVNTKAAALSGLTAADKVYDGTTAATVAHSGASFSGLVAGDTVTASGTTGTFATKQVGTGKTVTLTGTTYGGADAGNYTFTDQSSTTAAITAKAATLSGLTAADKVYDGTTAATVAHSGASFSGLVAGDTVTASGTTGTFATKQVGTGKTVTLTGTTYGGADAGNYTFTDQSSTTAAITAKAATLSGLTAADKVYDGTTAATVAHSGASFSGLVAGDTVTASGTTGTFATKQVGTGKTVTLTGTTYGGADAGNYTFTDQSSTTAAITAKAATLSGLTAADKVYDGTTAATVAHSGASFSGLVAGDTVTASGTTGTFATKQVGTGKTVTLTGTTYGGADAGNYTFTDQSSTTAAITAKAATLSGLTAADKVYDGTTAATVAHSGASFSGLVAGDTVTASGTTGTFATKQVGTGKTVTLTGTTYGGADAGNYTFTDQSSTTAAITAKAATLSGLTAADKVYDGTTAATVAHSGASFSGLVAGDTVTASGTTGTFATKQVGTGKTVTLTGTTYGGADAGNYTFTDQSSTTAAITAKAATLSGLTAADKVYDGTTAATVAHSGASFSGLVAGDTVTASGTTGTFATKQVGTGKTVTLTGTTYGGADAGNYTFTDQSSTTAAITAKAATLSGLTAADKVYDGTTAATVAHSGASFSGLVAGDTVTASGTTGTFATKQVGTGKTVTLTGTTYGGADAGNYTFTDQSSTTAAITAKAATLSGLTAADKVYDGTTAATVAHSGASFSGLVAGDTVTASGTTGTFATKQVGTGKTVTLTGTTYGGADAGNYTFTDQSSTTAAITAKAATLSGLTAADKVYDGTTAATVAHSGASFSGLVAGDTVTASGTTGTFATKQVGTGKTVTLTGTTYGGADAGNYTFTDQSSTTAAITAKALAIDLQGQGTRVYDGTTTILLNSVTPSLTGVVSGDTVNVATGNVTGFLDKNAGTNKAVIYSGFGLSGADAGNYELSTGSASSTASITPKAVTVSGLTAANKVYDGTTSATVAHSGATFTGLVAGDTVTASGTIGIFADALVGVAKPVTLTGTVYGGADAGNYAFTHQTATSASIVARNTSSQFQQYLGGITQLSQNYKPVPGSSSTLPPQSLPLVSDIRASTGGAGTAGLATLFPIDGLIVNWIREHSVDGTRIVTVSIPQSIIARGDMISFELPEDLITALTTTPNLFAQTNGNPLPVWLEYNETKGQFRIAEPATISSLPYEVVANLDQSRVLVRIDTR